MHKPDQSPLFEAFPPTPTEAWEALIAKDLKGADYREKLAWPLAEGVSAHPFYRAEDLADLGHTGTAPGNFPFVRGTAPGPMPGRIRQDIAADDPDAARRAADAALAGGAEDLGFVFTALPSTESLAALLDGLPPETSVHLMGLGTSHVLLGQWLGASTPERPLTADVDPLADDTFGPIAELLRAAAHAPDARLLLIDAGRYTNAGGDAVQTLGFTLAAVSECLAEGTAHGLDAGTVANRMHLVLPIGTAYFVEIAKLRAMRMLFAQVVAAYVPGEPEPAKAYIQAVTDRRVWTLYDPHVNLLRGTTMAAAALIGGCDTLTLAPFDAVGGEASAQGVRLARNTTRILKDEAYLGHVADAAGGSYYLEQLTDQLAHAAWALFQSVEAAGGWRAAMHSGMIPDALADALVRRTQQVAERKTVLVGTNQYPNLDERALPRLDALTADDASPADRDAAPFEQLRLRTERHAAATGAAPKVFLLPLGSPNWRAARASFARNFFGVAGFEIIENLGFETPEEGAAAAAASGAEVVVVCSADDDYPTLVPAVMEALRSEEATPLVLVAGPPGAHEATLREAGVADFIHIKTPLLDTLSDFQDRLLP